MVIKLSLLKNNVKEKLSIIILCAGKGTRLKKITKTTPKPLIRIKKFNDVPILHHLINNLINLEIVQIGIVIGYLGDKIRQFISTLEIDNQAIMDIVKIIDSKNQYRLGPLYSFLSITKNKNFFTPGTHYLVLPGDTIFDYNLLKEVLFTISNNFNSLKKYPFVFYRKIGLIQLKEIYTTNRIISNAIISKVGSETILKKIVQSRLEKLHSDMEFNQLIPIIALSYNSINDLLKLNQGNLYNTVWEILNNMINKGKKLIAYKIERNYFFYDIDYEYDLKNVEKKKKEKDNRCSD